MHIKMGLEFFHNNEALLRTVLLMSHSAKDFSIDVEMSLLFVNL